MKVTSLLLLGTLLAARQGIAGETQLRPEIKGPWQTIASDPDLGELTRAEQQPVDFGIWQAKDGTWQLWSCIRSTKEVGKTRLFYRWEGRALTEPNWKPMGVAMRADAAVGETPGGLQAPFVVKKGKRFYMFYGGWENICVATSEDGKNFTRHIDAKGQTGLFGEGLGFNTRDPMVFRVGNSWHCYYTAYPNQQGAVFSRESKNLLNWGKSRVVAFGGQSGTGPYSAECPFVVGPRRGEYFLFRTQRYGKDAISRVYHSKNSLEFGVNQDETHFVTSLPVAAPEIIFADGKYYIAALLPNLKGIQIAELEWR